MNNEVKGPVEINLLIIFKVERYWEDIAYHELRFPLSPYCIMSQPLIIASVGIEESPSYRIKALASTAYHSGKFWELLRKEKLRPPTNPDGSLTFSADLYRRLFNSSRIPGDPKDEIHDYFKTEREGDCPSIILIVSRGRVFYLDFLDQDGNVLSQQEFFYAFSIIRDRIENEDGVRGKKITNFN